jgi:hypothetical protein
MSLTIAGRLFTGPFDLDSTVVRANHPPAVFAIVAKLGEPWNPQFVLIDIGETGETGLTFSDHPLRAVWEQAAGANPPAIYLHSLPRTGGGAAEREALIAQLRKAYPEPNASIQEQGHARRGA